MRRGVQVVIGGDGERVGQLRYDRKGRRERAAFAYEPEWLAAADSFCVDPHLPLVPGFQFPAQADGKTVFPGAIADSAPDGWGRKVILRDHAKRRKAARESGSAHSSQPLGELDFLLSVDDESRVGALRFQDEVVSEVADVNVYGIISDRVQP